MHLPILRSTCLVCGVLAASALFTSVLALSCGLRRSKAAADKVPNGSEDQSEVPGEPSFVEDLVSHNWKGF